MEYVAKDRKFSLKKPPLAAVKKTAIEKDLVEFVNFIENKDNPEKYSDKD